MAKARPATVETRRLEASIAAVADDPTRVRALDDEASALATTVGGDLAFRWEIVRLHALLQAPQDAAPDEIRERYGELVERHGMDPSKMKDLTPLGARIRELEGEETLPRSMVVRSSRLKKPTS